VHLRPTLSLRLNSKLRGHYQYYGVNDNWPWLPKFRRVAVQMGLRWLRRRSQAATMSRTAYRIRPRFPWATETGSPDLSLHLFENAHPRRTRRG